MGLSRLKGKANIKAVRLFTNRENALGAFNRAIEQYKNENVLKILTFYGVGGIGKTHLLRKFAKELEGSNGYTVATIDAESPHYNSLIDILLDIRSQLHVNAVLFDYAIARFLTVNGRSLSELKKSWISEDSLLFDLQELASNLAEVVPAARVIKKLYDIADEKKTRYLSKYKKHFDRIDGFSSSELVAYIPHYLGIAIADASKKNKFVVFIDTLESLDKRNLFKVTKESPDEWITELIGSAESGLYVLASRNYIKWVDRNPEWEKYLEQHSLGALSNLDADYFLKSIPITDQDTRNAIIKSANGLPLYLDLCATTYLIKESEGQVINADDFVIHEGEVIKRFLAHLDVEHRESIKAMSVVSVFDLDLFSTVVGSLNINFPLSLFHEFCDTAYTNSINAGVDTFSIHSLIRSYLHDESSITTVSIILECIFREINSSLTNSDCERQLWLMAQVRDVISTYDLDISSNQSATFLESGIFIIERGLWSEISVMLHNMRECIYDESSFGLSVSFLEALTYRKKGMLVEAERVYKNIMRRNNELGKFKDLLLYYNAHTNHLLGRYSEALTVYKKLNNSQFCSGNIPSASHFAKRQIADILMMKGKFRSAILLFQELSEIDSYGGLWLSECLRFRGHVFRFNFDFESALENYFQAQELAVQLGADSMLGKVKTNLVETLCWTNPTQALEFSASAIEVNMEVNSPIELGKTYAALGIANAFLGLYEEACADSDKAIAIQKRTGYLSGQLFGLNAKAIINLVQQADDEAKAIIIEMREIISKIGVYGFLTYHFSLAEGSKGVLKEMEWLDYNQTKASIQEKLLSRLNHAH